MSNKVQLDPPAASEPPEEKRPATPPRRRRFRLSRFYRENREPIDFWLSWRLALLVVAIFTAVLVPRGSASPVTFYNFGDLIRERTIWGWTHWDGDWYADIAERGYWRDFNTAYYPLYPHLMRWLGFVLTLGHPSLDVFKLAGLLISSAAAMAACILLYRLARLEYDAEIARLSLAYFLAFPTSFFMAAVYTEGLFLALAVGAFYAARTNRWRAALILASLAVLTKNQGVFVAAALLVEYAQQRDWNWRKLDRKILYFALPALTLAGWFGWNALTLQNSVGFVASTQKYFLRYFDWPWNTMQSAFHRFYELDEKGVRLSLVFQPDNVPMLDLAFTIGFLGLALVAVWATIKGFLRPGYLALFLFCLIQPLCAPAEWSILNSLPRYMLIIFPAFFLLALAGRRWNFFHNLYFFAGLAMTGLLVARFTLGYWVS